MPVGYNHWNYNSHYQGPRLEIDPRALVARHIGWQKPSSHQKLTEWSTPEPDNFNLAIYDSRPVECPWLTCQIFAKYLDGWFSCYYCQGELMLDWNRWQFYKIKPWATWKAKPIAIRETHTMLTKDKRKNTCELTDNDVLYSMNNYERLKERTDFPELIDQRVGEPTGLLKEYLENIQ